MTCGSAFITLMSHSSMLTSLSWNMLARRGTSRSFLEHRNDQNSKWTPIWRSCALVNQVLQVASRGSKSSVEDSVCVPSVIISGDSQKFVTVVVQGGLWDRLLNAICWCESFLMSKLKLSQKSDTDKHLHLESRLCDRQMSISCFQYILDVGS